MLSKIVALQESPCHGGKAEIEGLKTKWLAYIATRISMQIESALFYYPTKASSLDDKRAEFAKIESEFPESVLRLGVVYERLVERGIIKDGDPELSNPNSYVMLTPLAHHYGRELVTDFISFASSHENWICDPTPLPIGELGKIPPDSFFETESDGIALSKYGLQRLSDHAGVPLEPFVSFHWFDSGDQSVALEWHVDSTDYLTGETAHLEPYYTITFSENEDAGTLFIRLPRPDYKKFMSRYSEDSAEGIIRFFNDLGIPMQKLGNAFLTQNPEVTQKYQESTRPGGLYSGLVNCYFHRSPTIEAVRIHFVLKGGKNSDPATAVTSYAVP